MYNTHILFIHMDDKESSVELYKYTVEKKEVTVWKSSDLLMKGKVKVLVQKSKYWISKNSISLTKRHLA